MNESFIAGGSADGEGDARQCFPLFSEFKKRHAGYRRRADSVNHTVCTFAIRDTVLLSLDELLDEGKNIVWLRLDLRYTSISSFRACATSQQCRSTIKSEVPYVARKSQVPRRGSEGAKEDDKVSDEA